MRGGRGVTNPACTIQQGSCEEVEGSEVGTMGELCTYGGTMGKLSMEGGDGNWHLRNAGYLPSPDVPNAPHSCTPGYVIPAYRSPAITRPVPLAGGGENVTSQICRPNSSGTGAAKCGNLERTPAGRQPIGGHDELRGTW